MERIDGLILTFVLNALWQIPAVLMAGLLGDRLLRRAPAGLRHGLWLGVLAACLLHPAASLLDSGKPRGDVPEMQPTGSSVLTGMDGAEGMDRTRPEAGPQAQFPPGLGVAIALLYGLSVAFHALRLARAWREAWRLARSAHPLEVPPENSPAVAHCRAILGMDRVEILGSSEVPGPVTVGAIRPLILLPSCFFESSSPEETATALGHELAHVRRRDYAVHLLSEILLLPIAFHPAVRVVRRRLAETREMACDEAALETVTGPRIYARSLLSLAAGAAGLPRPSTTLGVLDAQTLEVRMRRILDDRPRLGTRRARARFAAALLLLAGIGSAATAFAVRAVTGEPSAAGLGPFVGTWSGDAAFDKDGKDRQRVLDLEIRPDGRIVEIWYQYRKAEDGQVKVDKQAHPVQSFEIASRTLKLVLRIQDFKFRDEPPAPAELRGVLELTGDGEAVFKHLSNSYFDGARKRGEPVPPPPPPLAMKRVS